MNSQLVLTTIYQLMFGVESGPIMIFYKLGICTKIFKLKHKYSSKVFNKHT